MFHVFLFIQNKSQILPIRNFSSSSAFEPSQKSKIGVHSQPHLSDSGDSSLLIRTGGLRNMRLFSSLKPSETGEISLTYKKWFQHQPIFIFDEIIFQIYAQGELWGKILIWVLSLFQLHSILFLQVCFWNRKNEEKKRKGVLCLNQIDSSKYYLFAILLCLCCFCMIFLIEMEEKKEIWRNTNVWVEKFGTLMGIPNHCWLIWRWVVQYWYEPIIGRVKVVSTHRASCNLHPRFIRKQS